jgi:trigger factor
MARISNLALAACLISAGHAFTFVQPSSNSASSRTSHLTTHHPSLFTQRRTNKLSSPTRLQSTASADEATSTIKKLPQSSVELTLTIPPSLTSSTYEKVLSTVSAKLSIPGFRKGAKIPNAVIENAWSVNGGKSDLKKLAINELAAQLIEKTLKSHELEPIGQPVVIPSVEDCANSFKVGQEFELVVRCDVWPDIDWKAGSVDDAKPYLGLQGSYKRKPFNQERFDAALRDLTERYAKLEPFEDSSAPIEMGDACVVNMVGYLANSDGGKGEALPEGVASGDNVEVILGKGRYMEGLVEGLVGGRVGETKVVKVRFPDVSGASFDD